MNLVLLPLGTGKLLNLVRLGTRAQGHGREWCPEMNRRIIFYPFLRQTRENESSYNILPLQNTSFCRRISRSLVYDYSLVYGCPVMNWFPEIAEMKHNRLYVWQWSMATHSSMVAQ